MRDTLAERLLAVVMKWTPEDVARERPDLQALAAFKYDEYQQYSPGMRFVESLALWLAQFGSDEERKHAYEFVRWRLVFLSNAEIAHFVTIAFPDFIRPYLASQVAVRLAIPETYVARIMASAEYAALLRQSLFLGLSDGARMDLFRRSNPQIRHEQVSADYEISEEKAGEMRAKLGDDLRVILRREPRADDRRFKIIFLLDDFSGSGLSCIREEPSGSYRKGGRFFKGKLAKVFQSVDEGVIRQILVEPTDVHFCIVLYVATEQARAHIEALARDLVADTPATCTVLIVQPLPESIRLRRGIDDGFARVLEAHWDDGVMDEHLRKGGEDAVFGFNECGLPLVLSHNSPNNSVYLLWAESDRVRPLFPRVSRHRREA